MKKSFSMTEAEIQPVRKWHKAALAIWEDVAMKQSKGKKSSHVTRYIK